MWIFLMPRRHHIMHHTTKLCLMSRTNLRGWLVDWVFCHSKSTRFMSVTLYGEVVWLTTAVLLAKIVMLTQKIWNGFFSHTNIQIGDKVQVLTRKVLALKTVHVIANWYYGLYYIQYLQHIEAETNLTPFRRWRFQMHFLERKHINLSSGSIEICSQGSN